MNAAKLLRIAFWAAAAIAFVMALLPHPPQVPGGPSDKIQHIIAFAVLAVLARLGYPAAPTTRLVIGLSAFGALIEVLQAIPALHRDSDPIDWIADTAAAAFVLSVASVWRKRSKTH